MRSRTLGERLAQLERGSGGNDALLNFDDGKTVALNIRDPLALVCAAMRREHARDMGYEIPETRHRQTLDLLQRAASVTCDREPLVTLAHSVLHPQGGSQ